MKMFLCAVSIVVSACLIGALTGSIGGPIVTKTVSKLLKGG